MSSSRISGLSPRRGLYVVLLALVPASGCFDNFDPALYQPADAGMDALGSDAPTLPTLAYADTCDALTATTIPAGLTVFSIDTTTAGNQFFDLATCVGARADGNDVFLAFQATANERWHFHVRPTTANVNPVIYVLGSCQERECEASRAVNVCGESQFEHLSYLAPGGTFIVGIDTIGAGGFVGDLQIFRPVCGNGTAEHGESCDDGDLTDGNGCDALCRWEITPEARAEQQVNDDAFMANHVLEPDGATMLGDIGGGCDVDYYAIDLTAGQTLTATMDARGAATTCPSMSAPRLSIVDRNGTTQLEVSAPETGCPTATRAVTVDGTYYVRVTSGSREPWGYDLTLNVDP